VAKEPLSASLTLGRGSAGQVGSRRIALLEAIRDHGSIAAAAQAAGLSYKGAWDAVQALNNLFDRPLVRGHAGGRSGGETRVTAEGEAVIAAFHLVDRELARALLALEEHLTTLDGAAVSALLWSLSMKTSARNALAGTIEAVSDGAIDSEVILDIGGGQRIVAVVTRESVQSLGLAPSGRAVALIKASFIILVADSGAARTSARNCLAGVVSRREDGAVNSEIELTLSPGKSLTAIVTRESAATLKLNPGVRARALIKASHVILAVE
jgi:molybdate transport system regulatory protein